MDHSAGLDVSVKETNVCIVDDTGTIVPGSIRWRVNLKALLALLANPRLPLQLDWIESRAAIAMGHSKHQSELTRCPYCQRKPIENHGTAATKTRPATSATR